MRGESQVNLWARLSATQPHDRERTGDGVALKRVLGVPGLIGVGLGTMLGGIFATIGVGMNVAGPGVIASFVLSGVACVFVALCYAELAAMVPIAGSAYTYAYATLGEFVAWIIGWDLILEYGISVAPTAAAWSGYVQSFIANFGVTLPEWARVAHVATSGFAFDPATLHVTFGHIDLAHSQIDVLAIAVILVLTGVLALGIRESTSVNTLLVGIQVIAIGLFIVGLMGAVGSGGHALFVPPFPTGFKGVLTGAGLVFFAYIGFDTVTVASEEARNPKRDVPIAVIGSLVIGCLLYMGIAYVTVGLVPWKAIDPNAGMADAVKYGGNARWLVALVFAGAFAGTTTVMLTSLLGQVRIFYVMARDRMLPPVVARINVRTSTPLLTTLTTGAIVAILAGVIPIEALLALVNVGTLSAFVIVCVGVLVLRRRNPEAVRPFRAPLISVTAPLGALMCLGIMVGLGTTTWIRFIVWFVLGVAVYAAYGYRHSRLRGG